MKSCRLFVKIRRDTRAVRASAGWYLGWLLCCLSCSLSAPGQELLPALQHFRAPVPSPPPPGDAFAPPMGGNARAEAPACAEWTRTAGPDESVVLTGTRFSSYTGPEEAKDTRFALYDGTSTLKNGNIQRQAQDRAVVTLDGHAAPWGMYLLWAGNAAGYGQPIAINQTDAWWVGPDQPTPGATVAVYGRNLAHANDTLTSYVLLKPANGPGQWAPVTRVNPYKVDFTVPATLAPGEYEVWCHNGHGGRYGWSGPLALTVQPARPWSTQVFNVKDYGAVGNGTTDDTEAIRAALRAARQTALSTVYFPGGTYMVSGLLEPADDTRWLGDGPTVSSLKCAASFSSQADALVFGHPRHFELRNLGLLGAGQYRGQHPEPVFLRGSTDLVLHNVLLSFQGFNVLQLDNARNVHLTNCELIGKTSFLGHCSQLFIAGCRFRLTNDAEMALDSWGGHDISLTHSTCEDFDNTDPTTGAGWGKGRFYAGRGNFGSSYHTYIGHNRTHDLAVRPIGADPNSGEQYMWEGYATDWSGAAVSSTPTETTLRNFSAAYDNVHYVIVTKGQGLGQARRIVAYRGNTITVDAPWNQPPDQTSTLVIANVNDRTVLYGNYIDGKASAVTGSSHNASSGIQPYGATANFIAARNTVNEVRVGIANWATQHDVALDPNFFSFYDHNTLTNCRWGMQNGLYLQRPQEHGLFGTTYRANIVTNCLQSGIVNTLNESTVPVFSTLLYEHNRFAGVLNGFSTGGDAGLPAGFPATGAGIDNQILYRNTFAGTGGSQSYGIRITQQLALRENQLTGFATAYNGPVPALVLEAPIHVIDLSPGLSGAGRRAGSAPFTLWNSGTTDLHWSAASDAAWLLLSDSSGTLTKEQESETIALQVRDQDLAPGSYSATLSVALGEQVRQYTIRFRKPAAAGTQLRITSPFNNSQHPEHTSLRLEAETSGAESTVGTILFYADTVKLGAASSVPYQLAWHNVPAGTHRIIAKALDEEQTLLTTDTINVFVGRPLPVSLTAFTATPKGPATHVKWSTAHEYNNAEFRVLRGTRADDFRQLTTIRAQAAGAGDQHYAYLDAAPPTGLVYYRLLQVDKSGQTAFSSIISVYHGPGQLVGAPYPNPATEYVRLADVDENTRYRVINAVGRHMLDGRLAPSRTINVSLLPAGKYYLELLLEGGTCIRNFSKTE